MAADKTVRFDPPDLSYEYLLHRQFVETKAGVPAAAAARPAGHSENYLLQKGETLWTLSQMLYGDGQYWPRVWASNREILNPHLVRPGHVLELVLGSEDDAPAFRFAEEDERGVELVASPSETPVVEIPPPEITPRPVLKIPNSFPEWQSVYKAEGGGVLDDRSLGQKVGQLPDRIWLTAYVQDAPVEALGTFMETDGEAALPVANQYVYVKLKKGAASVGSKMLVVKDAGRVRRVNKQWDTGEKAYLVQIAAELELTEVVPSKVDKKGDVEAIRALVTRAVGISFVDHKIIAGQIQSVEINANGTAGHGEAQVIGSEKHPASLLYGPGELVFLNRGSGSGVEPGQLFNVFADRTTREPKTAVKFSPVPTGTIKVVRVTPNLATAVVLNARGSILQGDVARELSSRRDSEAGAGTSAAAPPPDANDEFERGTDLEDSGGDVEDELDGADDF